MITMNETYVQQREEDRMGEREIPNQREKREKAKKGQNYAQANSAQTLEESSALNQQGKEFVESMRFRAGKATEKMSAGGAKTFQIWNGLIFRFSF